MRESDPTLEHSPADGDLLTSVIDQFRAAWQSDRPPDIESFISSQSPDRPADKRTKLLLQLVAIDLEFWWRQSKESGLQPSAIPAAGFSRRPRIEEYLARFPELTNGGFAPLSLLIEEYRVRRRWGDQPGQDEYLARFPYHREALPAALRCMDRELGSSPPTTDVATLHNANDESRIEPSNRPTDDLVSASAEIQLPPAIGRYAVRKVLGKGAFGTVYLAYDTELNRLVALKVPRRERFQSPNDVEQFIAEARTAAQLRHPCIVAVHDIVRQPDGSPVVILDYIDGQTLKSLLDSQSLTPLTAAQLMIEVAEAVADAHRKGFVHRDLKPANILLDLALKPHVADFGLALHEDVQRERPGEFAGTIAYMAPEQIRAESHRLDGRADIWALGVILYQMLTGRLPFGGSSTKQLSDEIQHRDPKPPRQIDPSIPPELEEIISHCCAKRATDRYSTASDIAADLREWLSSDGFSSADQITARRERLPPVPSRSFSAKASCGGISLAFTATLALLGLTVLGLYSPPMPNAAPGGNVTGWQSGLRVKDIEVKTFERTNDGEILRGVLGKDSFSATLGDSVQVTAHLSKPGYAYLIAFRPDAPPELCFPDSEDVAPSLTDEPRYPGTNLLEASATLEGTGLWVFAAIASEKPLPPYKEVKAEIERLVAWQPIRDVPPFTVWWDDGDARVDQLTPMGAKNLTRGKDKNLIGPAETIVQLTDTLRTVGQADCASSFGFAVTPKK